MKKVWQWLVRLLPDIFVINRYSAAALCFGDMESYCYMGEPVGYDTAFRKWNFWEKELIRRRYIPLSLDVLIQIGGGYSGPEMPEISKAAPGAEIRCHSEIRKQQLEKDGPTQLHITFQDDNVIIGSYTLPSTEE